jgi:antitoxin ParD1/3/4
MTQIERMTIAIPAEMAIIVKTAVERGDYASNSEVFRDALRDWKHKREIQNQELEIIRAAVAIGQRDIKEGRSKPADEVFTRLEAKYSPQT